jgi:hypothetical protein
MATFSGLFDYLD